MRTALAVDFLVNRGPDGIPRLGRKVGRMVWRAGLWYWLVKDSTTNSVKLVNQDGEPVNFDGDDWTTEDWELR